MTRWSIHVSVVVLLFTLLTKTAHGQAGSAELTGQVLDSAGALLPNAKVTATEIQSGVSVETNSGAAGVYVFTNLRPGSYQVAAEATRFQTLIRKG